MNVYCLHRTFLLAYHMYSQSHSRSLQTPDDDANGFAAADADAAGNAMHVRRTDKSCVLVSMIRLQASEQAEVSSPELLLFCRCASEEYPPSPRDPKSAGFER